MPIDRLQAFYGKYYQPDNALLIVTGKFERERVLELIAERFGRIPRPDRSGGNRLWETYTREPTQDGERTVTLRRVGDVQVVMMSYHVPPGSHPDYAAIDILAQALGDQPSGRLYRGLVEPGLAASAGSFAYQLREAGPLLTFAQVRTEDDLSEAVAAMNEVLVDVLRIPVTGEEVDRAKTSLLNSVERTFNDPERIALQLSEWASLGDWRFFFLHRDRIEAVAPADVHRVAAEYLKPDNRTVGFFYPTDPPDRAEVPDLPDIASALDGYTGREAVAAGEAFDTSPSNVERRTTRYTLANGMRVAFLPKATRGETVNARFRVILGDEEALTGRGTAGSLAGQMLMRGSSGHTRQQIQDEFDRMQATGSVGGSLSQAFGGVQTIRETLGEALRLMAEIVREPTFPEDEFETLKEQGLAALEQQRSDPAALAQTALGRHMNPVPSGHPMYTATVDESVAALEAVTLDEVRAFHRDFYGPQLGTVAVVGDFDPNEIRKDHRGGLRRLGEPVCPATRISTEFFDAPAVVLEIETPDKANAFLFAQQNLALRDDNPDYPALILAGYMIGGGVMNSRLAVRIRRTRWSQLQRQAEGSADIPSTKTARSPPLLFRHRKTQIESRWPIREEIQRVLDAGFADGELETAKRGYLQSRELARAQDGNLVSMLNQGLYFDRTLVWDSELEERIGDLTVEDVNAAVRRHLDLNKMTFVKAGDFAGAESPSF